MRKLRIVLAAVLAALMLVATPPAVAGSPKGVCQAGGVNQVVLAETMRQYYEWYIPETWGYGGGGPQEIGRFFFAPFINGDPISADPLILQSSTSFSVRVGKTLVLPMLTLIGESYDDGSEDPPGLPVDYKASSLLLTVDGRVIVDSTRTKLDCLYFDEIYFAEPIPTVPTDYGSIASIYVKGLGILLPPMSPGEHIIEMQGVAPSRELWGVDMGYYNTWYVTVVKP